MAQQAPMKLTLLNARSSRVQDALDTLVDARSQRAARLIRALPEDELRLLLFSAVTSIDPRWKFPPNAHTPEGRAEAVAERTRHALADCLIENPQAIQPMIHAVQDALEHHDPRRADNRAEAA